MCMQQRLRCSTPLRCSAGPPVTSGVEVSPGVFKDVPGELKHRTEYVYAHTPGGPPRECGTHASAPRAAATCCCTCNTS